MGICGNIYDVYIWNSYIRKDNIAKIWSNLFLPFLIFVIWNHNYGVKVYYVFHVFHISIYQGLDKNDYVIKSYIIKKFYEKY